MANGDLNDATPHDAVGMTRRALLKELSKAPGVMGALLLPTSWATPLMEFAQIGLAPMCSNQNGVQGAFDTCGPTSVSLPFGAGETSAVSFFPDWNQVVAGTHYGQECTVTLTRSTRSVHFVIGNNGGKLGLVSGPASLGGSNDLTWSFVDSALTKITVQINLPKVRHGACSGADFGDNSDSFVMDLQVTGTQDAYTLELSRYSTRQCPSP